MQGKARFTRWAGGAAVALAAALLVASCGDTAPGGAPGASTAAAAHSGHAGHGTAKPAVAAAPLRAG
ncbi:hypothetical protein AB0J39_10205, partial [Microbispora sp. NPDC049633]